MSRRTNNSLRNPTEGAADTDLDAAWEQVPESTAVPLRAAPRPPAPVSAPSLPPVTIAPRPRSSSRVPAAPGGQFSMQGGGARGAPGSGAFASPAANDDPTLEVGHQFLDEALLELIED